MRAGVGEEEKEEEVNGEENGWRSGWRSCPPMARVGITTSSVDTRWEAETRPMTPAILDLSESLALSLSEPVHEHINQSPLERELFAKLKQEHDLAKAVKSDDAEVPVDLILAAEGATMKLDNQKNGRKGVCVYQECNGDPIHCPVRALGRRYVHLRTQGATNRTIISAYYHTGQ